MRRWYAVPIIGCGIFAARSEEEALNRATFEQSYGNYAHLIYEPLKDVIVLSSCDDISNLCDAVALLDKGHKMRTECGPKEIDNGTERS